MPNATGHGELSKRDERWWDLLERGEPGEERAAGGCELPVVSNFWYCGLGSRSVRVPCSIENCYEQFLNYPRQTCIDPAAIDGKIFQCILGEDFEKNVDTSIQWYWLHQWTYQILRSDRLRAVILLRQVKSSARGGRNPGTNYKSKKLFKFCNI